MGRRLWYPDRFAVDVIAHRLAIRIFPGYGDVAAGSLYGAPVKDNPLLESALALPRQPYYRTATDKAGALLRSMIKNHPFVDGNKRIGMATTFIFLAFNGYVFAPTNEEMVRFALELAASGPDMTWRQVARWIRQHAVPLFRTAEWTAVDDGALRWLGQLDATLAELRREGLHA